MGSSDSDKKANAPIVTASSLGLTDRQFDVLALMMEGRSNKSICRALEMSEQTVKKHVTGILKALRVQNRTEAVLAVSSLGWKPAVSNPADEAGTCGEGDVPVVQLSDKVEGPGFDRRSAHSANFVVPVTQQERPSIVVLPFVNLSGDPSQEYFADGMVEDITIALGRLPWLFVIGSGSAFTYKNRSIDPRQVGSDLGVRYTLRGSVRRDQKRVRITAQLTETGLGEQIWADRFDGELEDVFDMQDRVAGYVSTKIAPALQIAEVRRSERKPTGNLSAYDLYLRAFRQQRQGVMQNKEALHLLNRAIELDPSYGAAFALAGFCFFWQKVFGWVSPASPLLNEGVRLARRAAENAGEDSEALWMAAQCLGMLAGDLDGAVELVDKSTMLNPNSPSAWWTSCLTRAFLGEVETAVEHGARAGRLNPLDPLSSTHANATGLAHFFAGQYADAARVADKVLSKEPLFLPALRLKVATCGHLGRVEEGREAMARLLVVRPQSTVQDVREYYSAPLRLNPRGLDDFLEGMRLCGLD